MSASRSGACRQCGHQHRSTADVEACDAIHGRPRVWPMDVADPWAVCNLCGYASAMSVLVIHFAHHHGHDNITTGHLVRHVTNVRTGDDGPV